MKLEIEHHSLTNKAQAKKREISPQGDILTHLNNTNALFQTGSISLYSFLLFSDVNECSSNPCNKDTETCVNKPGSYKCKCKKGWVRTKKGDCIKKKKKKRPGKTNKKKRLSWQEQFQEKLFSEKVLTDTHLRIGSLLHTVFFGILFFLYKFERYYILASLVVVYSVTIGYLYSVFNAMEGGFVMEA